MQKYLDVGRPDIFIAPNMQEYFYGLLKFFILL
jgi:hypothetical protein